MHVEPPGDGPETGPEHGPEAGPEAGPETRAEHGPETRAERGPETEAEHGPETGPEHECEHGFEHGPENGSVDGPDNANETGAFGTEETAGRGSLAAGLYVVATPIGTARDITLRALDILREADVLAAEDTRSLRRLMEIHGIRREGRPVLAYHDHNAAAQLPRLLGAVANGRSVALVSDAGTPLVADPGYRLVTEAVAAGLPVTAAPGASALLAAVAVAGLPTDRFLFAGFLPAKAGARARALAEFAPVPASLVFYESPRRLADSLAAMAAALGADRPAAICRELTKRFEEVRRNSLGALAAAYAAEGPPKGEVVVVIGPPPPREATPQALDAALAEALETASVREASASVARALGLSKREVYARALALSRE